jgi:hypothetical protein
MKDPANSTQPYWTTGPTVWKSSVWGEPGLGYEFEREMPLYQPSHSEIGRVLAILCQLSSLSSLMCGLMLFPPADGLIFSGLRRASVPSVSTEPWYHQRLVEQETPSTPLAPSMSVRALIESREMSMKSVRHVGLVSHGRGAAWTILNVISFIPGCATSKLILQL